MRSLLSAALLPLLALAPATSAAPAKKRPDLRETVLTLAPATAAPGATVTATSAVANRGRVRAGRSTLGFYLSRDVRRDGADVLLTSRSVRALKPRKHSGARTALVVPAATAPGSWFVVACADATLRIKEKNERNNCRAGPLTVTPPAATQPGDGGTVSPPSDGGSPPAGGGPTPPAETCGDHVDNDADGMTDEGCFATFVFERPHTTGSLTFGPPSCTDSTVPDDAHVGTTYVVNAYAVDPYCERVPFASDTFVQVTSSDVSTAVANGNGTTFMAGQSQAPISIAPLNAGDVTFHVTLQTVDVTFPVHVSP